MEQVTGTIRKNGKSGALLRGIHQTNENQVVSVHGQIHALRHLGDVSFLILRLPEGLLQRDFGCHFG